MDSDVKLTGIINIPILNINFIINDIEKIIEKHEDCKSFTISSVTWKDHNEQMKNEYHKNVLFDIETNYDGDNTRYCFIDFFKNLGTYNDGIKKHIISLMEYYVWNENFDIVNIKNLKKELIEDGISFDIIRKENN